MGLTLEEPYTGNPYVRFGEGRGSTGPCLLYVTPEMATRTKLPNTSLEGTYVAFGQRGATVAGDESDITP